MKFRPIDIAEELCKLSQVQSTVVSYDLARLMLLGLHSKEGNPFDNYFDPVVRAVTKLPKFGHIGTLIGFEVFIDQSLSPNTLKAVCSEDEIVTFIVELP
jgi:hypothetical protein